jgi:precorrin-6B methylase 1
MTDHQWDSMTTDEKLDWLRQAAEQRLQQCNAIAGHQQHLWRTQALQNEQLVGQVGALTAKVEALEKALAAQLERG